MNRIIFYIVMILVIQESLVTPWKMKGVFTVSKINSINTKSCVNRRFQKVERYVDIIDYLTFIAFYSTG